MATPLTGEVIVEAWTDDRTLALAALTWPSEPGAPGEPGPVGYWRVVALTGPGRSVFQWRIPVAQPPDVDEPGPGEGEDLNHLRNFYPHIYEWAVEIMQAHSTVPPGIAPG